MLEHISLFSGLPPELLHKWEECFTEKRFGKRQALKFPHECGEAIYFLRSGRVKVCYVTEEGKEFTVAVLAPGDAFSVHSQALATALDDTAVIYLGMNQFRNMLTEAPELSLRLIRVLGGILRDTNDVILDLAFRDVSVRLAHAIVRAGQRDNSLLKSCPLGFTHEELASLSGTTRQTANEILKRWERQGIVALSRGKLVVLDWEMLIDKL